MKESRQWLVWQVPKKKFRQSLVVCVTVIRTESRAAAIRVAVEKNGWDDMDLFEQFKKPCALELYENTEYML